MLCTDLPLTTNPDLSSTQARDLFLIRFVSVYVPPHFELVSCLWYACTVHGFHAKYVWATFSQRSFIPNELLTLATWPRTCADAVRSRLENAKRTGHLQLECLSLKLLPGAVFAPEKGVGYTLEHLSKTAEDITRSIGPMADTPCLALRLSSLCVAENPLESKSFSLKSFRHLMRLDVSSCALTSVPSDIVHCTLLQVLLARNNTISELPESLRKLSQLEVIDVSNNSLHSLPKAISFLPLLCSLQLRGNAQLTLGRLLSSDAVQDFIDSRGLPSLMRLLGAGAVSSVKVLEREVNISKA